MAITQVKGGGTIITGEHINWVRLVSMLLALRMEMLGIKMTKGKKASVLMKEEMGLPKKHENRMVLMYANNVMFCKGLIGRIIYNSNIKYLQTRFND